MPVYDLVCPACGHLEEDYMCGSDDRNKQPCPKCAEMMGVKISAIPTHFGASFYKGFGVRKCVIETVDKDGKFTQTDVSHHFSEGNLKPPKNEGE